MVVAVTAEPRLPAVAGVALADQLLLAAAMCLISAWLGWKLHKACVDVECADTEGLPPTV